LPAQTWRCKLPAGKDGNEVLKGRTKLKLAKLKGEFDSSRIAGVGLFSGWRGKKRRLGDFARARRRRLMKVGIGG